MKRIISIALASTTLIACTPPAVENLPQSAPSGMDKVQFDGINFGVDSNEYAHDNQCDDPRFEGSDVYFILLDEDVYGDATDCLKAYKAGNAKLRAGASKS